MSIPGSGDLSPASPQPRKPTPAQSRAEARSLAQSFRHGALQALPFLLVLVPFSLLFGVVATAAGLDLAQTMGFSLLVLAGASQFTAVQLMTDQAPVLLVLASALAINLRMAMYSASLTPWLGGATRLQRALVAYLLVDQSYGLGVQHYEANPQLTVPQRMAFFMGVSTLICPMWMLFTLVGATAGNAIPPSWPLDFAVPITFLAMIAPMLRTLAHLVAALTAILSSLALAWLPSGTGLLIAGALGMAAGAAVETLGLRRQVRGQS